MYRAGGKVVRVAMDTPGIPQLSRGERTYGLNVQIPLINVTLVCECWLDVVVRGTIFGRVTIQHLDTDPYSHSVK